MGAPYIGVTGVVTPADVAAVAACVPLIPPSHRLMAGVLASAKTLRGDAATNRRYPPFRDVERLLSDLAAVGAWPVVHFNCRDGLDEHLGTLARALPSMSGLQLNMVRPDLGAVGRFLRARPDVEFILQVNRGAVGPGAPVTAEAIAAYVERCESAAEHALIDLSGGRGEPMDAALAGEVLRLWGPGWHAAPSFAGGLGPDAGPTLAALGATAARHGWRPTSLSFDVESRVRVPCADPIAGEPYQDDLDGDLVRGWVSVAAAAIGGAS